MALPLTKLRARITKALGLEPDSLVHPGSPELSTGHDPTRDPRDDPTRDPACDPVDAPAHEPAHDPASAGLYVVEDGAGVVVGLSDERVVVDSPEVHAAWLIKYAIDSDVLRGRWVVASVLRALYRESMRVEGVEPVPWPTVAALVGQVVTRKHKWVRIAGRRRRRLAT